MILTIHGQRYHMNEPMTLLMFMQQEGISGVYAACNGQGTCGKCQVQIQEAGQVEPRLVQACEYVPTKDVEVLMPADKMPVDKMPMKGTNTRGTNEEEADLEVMALGIDIGTTNVCYQMVCETADGEQHISKEQIIANPQAVYGADVMHRIQAANEGHLGHLHQMIEATLRDVCADVEAVSASEVQTIAKTPIVKTQIPIIISANTTMRYFLEERDPKRLGASPYEAEQIGWGKVNIGGYECDIIPGISAFVGGDIVSGIYALQMIEREETSLLLDLGTNGEMALAYQEHLYCSSAPAGPAFETQKLEYGSHLIRECSRMLDHGEMDENGNLIENSYQQELQQDIRTLQLGKSAIRAGAESLLHEAGITWLDISRIYLAGNFGRRVSPQDICRIGLLPTEIEDRIQIVGNVSLFGAVKLGQYPQDRSKIDAIVASAATLSLADTAYFGDKFIEYMFF